MAETDAHTSGREPRLQRVLAEIDAANAHDPSRATFAGAAQPRALIEGQRAHAWVLQIQPEASEALQIAARAHHLRRWEVERSSYPRTREGYLAWRTYLYDFHGRAAGELMQAAGYPEETQRRVAELLQKRAVKRDPEAQTHEDAVSLAFLELRLSAFLEGVTEEQATRALRRTWTKMSPAGREAALSLGLDERAADAVKRALS
ncbi:MAG: DUF4202 domain-containing protein [Dehalococcoidia bacterium]|nr:MAG: DUF4202 domain-containing protein [Dehalococcoidia bacterium]